MYICEDQYNYALCISPQVRLTLPYIKSWEDDASLWDFCLNNKHFTTIRNKSLRIQFQFQIAATF